MAKRSKKRTVRRRRHARGLLCVGDSRLAKFNPKTGKRFAKPMCVPDSGRGRPTVPRKAPSQKTVLKKQPALDCRSGFEIGGANPMTGKKFARPMCVRVLKNGKVKTHAPKRGKKSRASAVKIQRVVALSGRRRR